MPLSQPIRILSSNNFSRLRPGKRILFQEDFHHNVLNMQHGGTKDFVCELVAAETAYATQYCVHANPPVVDDSQVYAYQLADLGKGVYGFEGYINFWETANPGLKYLDLELTYYDKAKIYTMYLRYAQGLTQWFYASNFAAGVPAGFQSPSKWGLQDYDIRSYIVNFRYFKLVADFKKMVMKSFRFGSVDFDMSIGFEKSSILVPLAETTNTTEGPLVKWGFLCVGGDAVQLPHVYYTLPTLTLEEE